MSAEAGVRCVFAQRSALPCGPGAAGAVDCLAPRMQTLDELDAASLGSGEGAAGGPLSRVRVSWLILSRAGVNYLAHGASGGGAGRWLVCPAHRSEYLDDWGGGDPAAPCRYPAHDAVVPRSPARHPLTLAMSARVLQGEGRVAPVGARCCDACRARHDAVYPPLPAGEKMVLVVPRTPALAPLAPSLEVPSPFCAPDLPEPASSFDPCDSALPQPPTASIVHDASSPQITIKMEVLEEEQERLPTPLPYQEDITIKVEGEDNQAADIIVDESVPDRDPFDGQQTEDEDEGLFSSDSDDDRTWVPSGSKAKGKATRNTRRRCVGSVESEGSSEEEEEPVRRPAIKLKLPVPKRKKAIPKKQKDAPGNEEGKHYFCQICQITFYKHASFRQHMRSSKKAHQDIKAKKKTETYECIDCKITFEDRSAQVRHMLSAHNTRQRSFHCQKCDVFLKNESAFKSHNSKLHLQRNQRTFYCRVCDQIYQCRKEHRAHIKTHRSWSGEEPGHQCETCGKLFTSLQVLMYQRHLATHDDDPDAACSCDRCSDRLFSADQASPEQRPHNEVPPLADVQRPSKLAVLEGMRKQVSLEEDGSDVDQQYQCGLCSSNFDSAGDLEKHVQTHYKAADTESVRVTSITADSDTNGATDAGIAAVKPEPFISSKMKLTDNADRNWAAEFGYGKTTKPSGDLFLKMKSNFQTAKDDDDDDIVQWSDVKEKENDEVDQDGDSSFKLFRTRGFTGKIKASPKKVPRTLSDASLATRRRIETLIKRAREHQEKAKKSKSGPIVQPKAHESRRKNRPSPQPRKRKRETGTSVSTSLQVQPENREDDNDDENGNFDGFEDEDEALLYPLANGWVMERTPASSKPGCYLTSFWSPDGHQYDDVEEIKAYCHREKIKLDFNVFEKAKAKLVG